MQGPGLLPAAAAAAHSSPAGTWGPRRPSSSGGGSDGGSPPCSSTHQAAAPWSFEAVSEVARLSAARLGAARYSGAAGQSAGPHAGSSGSGGGDGGSHGGDGGGSLAGSPHQAPWSFEEVSAAARRSGAPPSGAAEHAGSSGAGGGSGMHTPLHSPSGRSILEQQEHAALEQQRQHLGPGGPAGLQQGGTASLQWQPQMAPHPPRRPPGHSRPSSAASGGSPRGERMGVPNAPAGGACNQETRE